MPRTLSPRLRRAINAQESAEVLVTLVELTHPTLPAPIRVCNDSKAVTSEGVEYVPFPFRFVLADDADEAPPTARLVIDAVDRRVIEAVRAVQGDCIRVVVREVLAAEPDVVEIGPLEFDLRSVTATSTEISGTLAYEPILGEPYPKDLMTPDKFPGLKIR